ncbi:MAG TPA: trypsin-like peptidase domain-containing protein [Polyangiaceae bacterium]|nr:trypsin-like peptidase domain-containing protein [Polyangiaceae bacterium]
MQDPRAQHPRTQDSHSEVASPFPLTALSDQLSALAQKAESSLVRVEGRRGSVSSGVAVGPGLVLTAAHGLGDAERVTVSWGERTESAERLYVQPEADLALLRLEAQLPTLAPAEVASLRVGELVLAVGRPGDGVSARLGVIAALGEAWRLPGGLRLERYIETDIGAAPGFAGGAILRANGEWVGLINSHASRTSLVALPAPSVLRFVEALRSAGGQHRPRLGVSVQGVKLPSEWVQRFGRECGLLVMSVLPGSPAARAGVLLGDVLLAAGSAPLACATELECALFEAAGEREQAFEVLRGGELRKLLARFDA